MDMINEVQHKSEVPQKTRESLPHLEVVSWLAEGLQAGGSTPAVVCCGEVLSHVGLDLLSNQISRYLSQRGVGSGDHVGICLDRSIELIAVLIGILKAGAAYVPLDPEYPGERLSMMVEDAEALGKPPDVQSRREPVLFLASFYADGRYCSQPLDER
jgi:non-ribosomal peptide synthetase component F